VVAEVYSVKAVGTLFRAAALLLFLLVAGCATSPPQTESLDYRARAESQVDDGIRVSAVVLSPQESEQSFSIPLAKKGIQPVWLEIENQEDKEFYLMLLSLDPDYFAPSEVAWVFRGQGEGSLGDKIDPVVDEARLYITLDVAAAQALRAVGYVKGVGYSDRESPRFNYTEDPYYTDGLRIVLILGEERRSLDSIENLRWENPPSRHTTQ
jgi:hypothetical protein